MIQVDTAAPGPGAEFLARAAEQVATTLDFARYRPSAWTVAYAVGAASLGLISFLVTWSRGGRATRELRRAFALNMGSVALSLACVGATLSAGDATQAQAATRTGMVFASLLGPATLHFVSVLTGWRRPLFPWVASTTAIGLGFGLISLGSTSVVVDAYVTPFGYASLGGWLMPFALVHLGACMIGALVVLLGRLRESTDPRVRRQLRAVIFAYGLGNLTVLDLLPLWGVLVVPSSYLWVTGSAVVLSVAIHEHQLLDAPDFGWRAIAWLSTSALVLVPVLLVLGLLHRWQGWGEPVATTAVLFGIFLLTRAYHTRLQPLIDDLFLRRRRDLSRELDALSEHLLVLRTAADIADEVAHLLHRTLYARLTAFAIRDDDGWRMLHSAWGQLAPPDDDDPIVASLAAAPGLLQRGAGPELGAETERLLSRYGAEVLVPMPGAQVAGLGPRLAALIAVGPRWDARPFEPFELAFLARLPAVVAGPLAAARLYDRRHRLREELEAKVAAKSAELARALAGLENAQTQLVQSEKMATLGLVTGGVSGRLQQAISTINALMPRLEACAAANEAATVESLASVPPGPKKDEIGAWIEKRGLDFMRKDIAGVVGAIAEGARRAHAIAADLSHFARGEGVRLAPADLHRAVDASLNLLFGIFKGRIEMVRNYAPNLPQVVCEIGPLGQVFMNLVMNAGQAIDGRGRITVTSRVIERGHFVEIAIADSGKGIPPEILPRIFEPFFTTKPLGAGGGGSGLGLSLSYGIVARHGGRIEVESTVGVGTTMRVVLPTEGPRRLAKGEGGAVP
jgi:signal transduction histidine kinase